MKRVSGARGTPTPTTRRSTRRTARTSATSSHALQTLNGPRSKRKSNLRVEIQGLSVGGCFSSQGLEIPEKSLYCKVLVFIFCRALPAARRPWFAAPRGSFPLLQRTNTHAAAILARACAARTGKSHAAGGPAGAVRRGDRRTRRAGAAGAEDVHPRRLVRVGRTGRSCARERDAAGLAPT